MVKVELSLRQMAAADALYVTATVPAPVPTTPAVIQQPVDGTTVNNPSVTVSGTCPETTPVVTVAIYDNGNLAGSVPCSSGTFSLVITLSVGSNSLVAKTYTVTGDSGPDSTSVHVTYTPSANSPPTSPGNSQSQSGSGSVAAGLTISSVKPFINFGPGQAAEWIGAISGGTAPYTVTINWGDGSSTTYRVATNATQHFTHTYTSFVPHIIRIHASDRVGNRASTMFAAVTPYAAPTFANILSGRPRDGSFAISTLLGLYIAYLAILAIFGGFWLHAHRRYAPISISVKRPLPATRRNNRTNHSVGRRR